MGFLGGHSANAGVLERGVGACNATRILGLFYFGFFPWQFPYPVYMGLLVMGHI